MRNLESDFLIKITSLTTMLSFINPYTRMAGTELVFNLFAECHKGESHEGLCPKTPDDIQPLIAIIGIAMIIKAALTVITFGIKLPAGIFIPTLGVGACFGRIVGFCVQYLYWTKPDMWLFKSCNKDPSCIVPGIYAMVSLNKLSWWTLTHKLIDWRCGSIVWSYRKSLLLQ